MPDANPRNHADEGPPLLTRNGPVATITLRRPAQRNSLRNEDLRTLLDLLAQLNADPGVTTLLLTADTTGQPRPVFCAGYHVGGFEQADHDPRQFEQLADAVESARPITLCAMNGSAYGGATDLVLACDLRIALAGTELRMPACVLGLHYYPTGLRRYVARLGLNLAKRAFLTAAPMTVESLQSAHLFEQIVPADAFDATVHACVQRLQGLAPLALQATKQSLNEIASGRYDEPAMRARETRTTASADFAEGRAALAQRRRPHFTGR